MKLKKLYILFVLLPFIHKGQDKILEKDYIFCIIINNCVTDSTAFLNSDSIVFDLAERDYNVDCPNKPKSRSCCMPWPTGISINLGEGIVFLDTNKELVTDSLGFVTALKMKPRMGKVKYNKKNDTMTMFFKQYNWKKTFKVFYRKKDEILILSKIS